MFDLKDWFLTGHGNDLCVVDEGGVSKLVITQVNSKPSYLMYKRRDGNFAAEPADSSFSAEGQGFASVEVDINHNAQVLPLLGATNYFKDADGSYQKEQCWGSDSKITFKIEEDHDKNSFYIRFSTPGVYEIVRFEFEVGLRGVFDEIVSFDFDAIKESSRSLTVKFDALSAMDCTSSALVAVEWTGAKGERIAGLADHAVNPKIGPYEYIHKNNHNEFSFLIPNGASKASVVFHPWKNDGPVYIRDNWEISVEDGDEGDKDSSADKLRSLLSSVPSGQKVVVLHTTAPPLGHATLSLRPNRLAVEFEKLGYFVIFLPFSVVPDGLIRFDDKAWVICRSLWPVLQHELAKRRDKRNVFVCTSFPNFEAMSALDLLGMAGWTTVYEIRDDMEEFNRVGYSKWFNNLLEQYVAERADKVLAVSPRLAQKANIIAGRSDAVVSPNAVSDLLYERGRGHRGLEFLKSKRGNRTVGYLGHLTDSWFDWRMLISTALSLPDYDFRIIGHGMPARLEGVLPKNMRFLGPMTHEDFIDESKKWSVGLIPFKISPLTFGVDPNKLYEYLALGVRVVSAPMGSVDRAPMTTVYRTSTELRDQIVQQSNASVSLEEISELEAYLSRSRWEYRAGEIVDIFNEGNDE